jgi:hypothetical protein
LEGDPPVEEFWFDRQLGERGQSGEVVSAFLFWVGLTAVWSSDRDLVLVGEAVLADSSEEIIGNVLGEIGIELLEGVSEHVFFVKTFNAIVRDGETSPFGSLGIRLYSQGSGICPARTILPSWCSITVVHALTPKNRASYEPSLSPDGSTVVYEGLARGTNAIFSVSIAGTERDLLSANEPGHTSLYPCFSPDGKYIAYYRTSGHDEHQIWVMNADGSEPHQVTHLHNSSKTDPIMGTGPAWQSR